jgi:O-antigen/teichoic acid export membrane protein
MLSKRFALEGGWVIAGQVSSVIGLLASLRVLTNVLSPAAFGEFTLGLTVAFFANQIIFGPVANGIARYYTIASQANQTSSYVAASGALLSRATALTIATGLLIAAGLWALDQHSWACIVLSATALAFSSGYSGALSTMLTAARHRAWVACQQGLEPWIKLMCAVGMVLGLGRTGASPLIGYALGHLASGLALRFVLARVVPADAGSQVSTDWGTQIRDYARPFLLFAFFTWANISSDRWALQHFAGTREVGLYAAAFMLGYSPMSTISAVLVQLAAPVIYQSSNHAGPAQSLQLAKRQCDLLAGAILIVTGMAWLIAFCFHGRLFDTFIAKDYRSASSLMPWMILAGGIFSAGEAAAVFLNSAMRTHLQIAPKITTALIGMGLNLLSARYFGSEGVVFSVLTFSILYFLWLRYIVWRTTSLSTGHPRQESSCAIK